MAKRYFIHLSYAGQNYCGWQTNPNISSVQEKIETALSSIFKESMTLFGCGRTDTAVHASQYFAHFHLDQDWEFDLVFRLNKLLPDDISVYEIIPSEKKQHARYHANKRSYQYFIHTKKVAHLKHFSSLYSRYPLDFECMGQAISLLKNYTDFRGFCKSPDQYPSTECTIYDVQASINTNGFQFCFEITANRFLRGMIRNIMAKVIKVGNGQMTLEEFESFLQNPDPKILPIPAAPEGLYLSKVIYPFLERDSFLIPKDFLILNSSNKWIPLLKL